MSKLIICGDDYGYNPEVSETLIELTELNRLNAISCMTNLADWKQTSRPLQHIPSHIQLGLHLNLTEGLGMTDGRPLLPLPQLIRRAFLRQLNPEIIRQEIERQFLSFAETLGRIPDFIDGHQHVHHLPIIRQALLSVYAQHIPTRSTWVRVSYNGFFSMIKQTCRCAKAMIIFLTGAHQLKKALILRKIPFNPSFSGIYQLNPNVIYANIFRQFLKDTGNDGLIFCHPGNNSPSKTDVIAQARQNEYNFFISNECESLLAHHHVNRTPNQWRHEDPS